MWLTFWCELIRIRTRWRAMLPQDSIALAITTGLGFSVLAGIFSGVVYIITTGYKRRRPTLPRTPWHCSLCGAQFRSIDGVLETANVITCIKCKRRFCKLRCSKRAPAEATGTIEQQVDDNVETQWVCKKCQPDSWLTGFIRLLQCREPKVWYTKKMTADRHRVNSEVSELQRKEREQVRDFIERLVEALLGGELDNVSVKKIYNDDRYDAIYARYHGDLSTALTDLGSALHLTISSKWYLPIAGESPCSTHTSLKNLIQRFIREASELPELQKTEDGLPATSYDTNDRTYEDLLSTAIINKVVQNYQNQHKAPSVSGRSKTSSLKQTSSDREYFLGERNLDRFTDNDVSSISSFDYVSHNPVSRRSIDVESSSDEEREQHRKYDEDEVDTPSIRNNEWQENWYLRKRNFASGTNSPVPVPMLVPNPSEHAKVLIGDREADDTTDLSDAISDYEEEPAENSSLNAMIVNAKTIIGGRNPLESLVAKAESISNGETNEAQLLNETSVVQVHHQQNVAENEKNKLGESYDSLQFVSGADDGDNDIIETCNQAFIRDDLDDAGACADVEDHSFISLESNTEKNLEYTEKYATLPRKIPMPTPRESRLIDTEYQNTSYLMEDHKTDNADSGVTSDEDEKQKTFKCSTYGEREKQKWNHGIELANNPYSKSNLEERLNRRSSSINSLNSVPDSARLIRSLSVNQVFDKGPINQLSAMSKSLFEIFNEERKNDKHRYGADYFVKAAGRPHGALKKDWIQNTVNDEDGDDEVQKSPVLLNEPVIVPESSVFRAIPALVHDDEQIVPEEESSIELSSPTKNVQPWEISSDSDYSIERTYHVNSGRIIKKLGEVQYEIPTVSENAPQGIKYTPKEFDENQNNISPIPTIVQRTKFLRSLTQDDDTDTDALTPITPPAVNHFKLVNEIANETSDEHEVIPISPPAEYKTSIEEPYDIELVSNNEVKPDSIEYESYTKSLDITIDEDCDLSEDHIISEESLSKQIISIGGDEEETAVDNLCGNDEKVQEDVDNEENSYEELPNVSHLDELLKAQNKEDQNKSSQKLDDELTMEEIDQLKEKHVVKHLLSAFSKSFPALNKLPRHECATNDYQPHISNSSDGVSVDYSSNENDIEIEDASLISVPSVNCLKKKFEYDSDFKKEVHSLTARSLPKHVRQELAAQTIQPPKTILRSESLREVSPEAYEHVAFPQARSKIAFFEQMSGK